jgi:hypothetical protein
MATPFEKNRTSSLEKETELSERVLEKSRDGAEYE